MLNNICVNMVRPTQRLFILNVRTFSLSTSHYWKNKSQKKKSQWHGRLEYLNRGDPFDQTPPDVDMETLKLTGDELNKRNRLYAWGNAEQGALGEPNYPAPKNGKPPVLQMQRPHMVQLGLRYNIKTAAVGYGFTLFVTDDKERPLWGTGINTSGQLGFHQMRSQDGKKLSKPLSTLLEPGPIDLPLRDNEKVVMVDAGRAHTLVLTNSGQVLALGNNSYGQCGRDVVEGEDYFLSRQVHRLELDEEIVSITAGQDHSLFVTKSGQVFSCGWGADGQTGQGHYHNTSTPGLVGGDLQGVKVTKVTCAVDCVLALTEEGQVIGWGNSEYGQFSCVSHEQQLSIPRYLPLELDKKVVDVASGGTVCLVLTGDDKVYVWGYGILGKGPGLQQSKVPELIPEVLFGRNAFTPDSCVKSVFAGLGHQAVVTNNGDMFVWGRNRSSCLGLGRRDKDQYFPLKVAMAGKVTGVWLGVDHTVTSVRSWMSPMS